MTEAQRYHVIERIAAGGMAEVYRGESAGIEGFRKKVAIKRVLPKLSQNVEFLNMFLDEARLGAYLSHSKCVQVFDIGQGGGAHFIVMEFVDGADLKDVLEHLASHGRLMGVEAACRIAIDICEGLAYAHQATDHAGRPLNIVHRDISPHNVLMTRFGEVKLVDFGLAKASSHLSEEDEDIVKGKFGYLAPEVTLGQGADKRVDIFAAGILLWEMLTGKRLFQGSSDVETFKLVRAAEIPDPRLHRSDIPDEVVRVLTKALARDRDQRYPTADAFAQDLSQVLLRLRRTATYVDIAELVKEAAAERTKRRKVSGKDTAGVIGDLIIDTLHDFSSEADADGMTAEQPSLGTPGVDARSGAFVDPSAWGLESMLDEEALVPKPPPQRHVPPPAPSQTRQAAKPAAPVKPQAAHTPDAVARPQQAAAKKEGGPFWRRWFGS